MDPALAWDTIGLFDLDNPDRRIAGEITTATLIIDTEPAGLLRERLANDPNDAVRDMVNFACEQWERRIR